MANNDYSDASKDSPKGDDALLAQIREFVDCAISAESDNNNNAVADLRFLAGEQWPENIAAERRLDGRPCLTFNRLPTYLNQVTNDQRQNKSGIKVHPVGDEGDIETAEVIQGMIRHIEYDSNGDTAYDTAVNSAASIGKGFWRLVTEYESPTSFNQVIKYKRERDPLKVYFDPASVEADGSDAKCCAIVSDMHKSEFTRAYPKATPQNNLALGSQIQPGWMSETMVRVVEYYYFDCKQATLYLLGDGSTTTDQPEAGVNVVNTRATEIPQLKWCKATAGEVLERADIMCQWIPVFPVWGTEVDIQGKVIRKGIIRDARDPAQMYNFWMHQSLDTPVVTPTGWSTIGDLKVGDKVFSDAGEIANVIGKSPVYIGKDCYRVTFGDGSEVVSSAEHPWVVEERGKRTAKGFKWQTRKLRTDELDPAQHCVKAALPLQMPNAELALDPYVLGVWLGDGSRGNGSVSSSREDIEYMRAELAMRGARVGQSRSLDSSPCFTIYGISPILRDLGILNSKKIPDAYMRASVDQRLELLRGLMDTDGSVHNASGSCMFTQADPEFADQVRELIASLGIRVGVTKRAARVSKMANGSSIFGTGSTQLAFMPPSGMKVFSLPRKSAAQMRERKRHPRRADHKIVKVERVESVPVQCIGIDAPSHLYLCGHSMIPTHNTSATEEVTLRPKTPFIGAEGQFEGHKNKWAQANSKSFAYLEYKPVTVDDKLAPPPQRSPMADVPAGMLQMAIHAADNIKAVTGLFDASLGAAGNETSGKAILARKKEGDTANFHYTDNLNRSIRHCARCIISMIPHYYDAPRVVQIMREDGTVESTQINTPQINEQTQAIEKVLNDLTIGRYGVTFDSGPSYATMREEAAESMIAMGQSWPKLMDIAGDKVVKAMDWPGAEEIAQRIKATIPANITQQDEGENGQEQGPPPLPPEVEQALQNASQMVDDLQQQLMESKAGIEKARIDAASREEVARINSQGKADAEEIKGLIQMLINQMPPPPGLVAAASQTEDSRPAASQAAESAQTGPTGVSPGSESLG